MPARSEPQRLNKRGDRIAIPGKRKGQMTEYEHLGRRTRGKTKISGVIVRKT